MWLFLLACRPEAQDPALVWEDYDPLPYVDPFIGTGGPGAQTTGVNPGAARPFGQTLVGPDTRDVHGNVLPFYHYGGYHYDDATIDGFSHTHSHGMGVVDFGGLNVMPRGAGFQPAHTTSRGRTAPFDHEEEWAGAGWYSVELQDDHTLVEIVATDRGALHRYRFDPAAGAPAVVLDLGHVLPDVQIGPDSWLEIMGEGAEIRGLQRLSGAYSGRYGGMLTSFVARFDPAPVSAGAWSDPAAPTEGAPSASGSTAGAWVTFAPGTAEVTLRVALSTVDLQGAQLNLQAELPEPDYDAVLAEAQHAWQAELAPARIWADPAQEESLRKRFHTAQYYTMLMPRRYDDVDGRYRGLDGLVHEADFPYYSDLSLWDTFRTVHPWYTLVQPERQRDMLRALVRMTEDGGTVPRWPLGHGYTGGMVGSPGSIVMAESALKALDGWDQQVGFDASYAQSTTETSPISRTGIEDWTTLGYVSSDHGKAASLTLEYAWADASVARWAELLGRTAERDVLAGLGAQWRNTWDSAEGFFQSRHRDGSFTTFEGELTWSDDYTEGNAWHYLWTVPHDVQGMIEVLHGGDVEAFHARYADYWQRVYTEPDDNFPDDWYWHGNEPVLHYAWLGSLTGRRDLTAEATRWILEHRYGLTPQDGLDGNDDAGTLSAWYLWGALGIYPIAGTDLYALGSPLVWRAELQTEAGPLVIEAPGSSRSALYPQEITLLTAGGDELELDGTLTHAELLGGQLSFELSDSR
jgi:predicted alpha-1,2-mannosidase